MKDPEELFKKYESGCKKLLLKDGKLICTMPHRNYENVLCGAVINAESSEKTFRCGYMED